MASDTDLKLSDTLRYYSSDVQLAKELLYRRLRCLANYELANKNLERARAKNRDIIKAESDQQNACQLYEKMTKQAREELANLKVRRVAAFKKSLIEHAELQMKHAKEHVNVPR
ncbi:unnamed protein product [Soboliphyme baturini]|uniref:Vps5 domain-containing protein n=1 Tax=Soboliphyme baturini TaxID=241478 RepID=A0A183IDI3_9BILA|nr:unnamed protein product [Soboliphyme baturini]